MAIVAGVDYGTLSVRVSVVDSERGRLGSGVADYPLNRRRDDPDHATQSHADHMRALVEAMGKALASAKAPGETIEAIAIDTTGSSVIPVDENLEPIDDYYLWCEHRAWREAALITETAHRTGLPAIQIGHHRVERHSRGREPRTDRRLLSLVRPSGVARSGAHHRDGPPHWASGDPMVRRGLFLRVGLFQAAALAPAQPWEARPVLHGAGTLRYGCGHAVRHPRSASGAPLHLRHGAQVDVERFAGRPAAGRVPGRSRSPAEGR